VNLYVDSSVLLRIILGEPDPLPSWSSVDRVVASELVRVECLRTIDRARLMLRLDDRDVARHRFAAIETIESLSLVALSPAILERAADPFPTVIGSLDAIHLASAVMARSDFEALEFATHDIQLGTAAQAMGFSVQGI
jgi:predicted nucleic acid-binding protein